MLKAYLRHPSYIKPDYQHGRRSRYRERALLEAMSCEENLERTQRHFSFKSSLLEIMQPSARRTMVDDLMEMSMSMDFLEDLNVEGAIRVRASEKRKSAKEVYEIMEKQGFWDKLPDFTATQWNEIIERIKLNFKERREAGTNAALDKQ